MMHELEKKVLQEKYFNSIRYFAHTLPSSKRDEFILLVGDLNIFLAAQCVMSGASNPILEEKLIRIAESRAKQFTQPEISAQGFLALSEFEKFDIILFLFSSITSISGLYRKVISNILSNANPDIFYKFLEMLSEVNHPPLIQDAITSYNGLVVIDNSNKKVFAKIILAFIQNSHFGTLRVMLNKFSLTDEFEYITDVPIEKSINKLLKNKKYTSVNLACELVIGNSLFGKFPIELIIQYLLQTSSNKGIIRAIKLNEEYNLGPNKNIDTIIEDVFLKYRIEQATKLKSKKIKIIKSLIKKGAADYLKKHNSYLHKEAISIISGFPDYKSIEYFYRQREEKSFDNQLNKADVSEKDEFNRLLIAIKPIEDNIIEEIDEIIISLFKKWFEDVKGIKLENLITLIIKKFDIEFLKIKALLKTFVFTAEIINKSDYVIYVKCPQINTDKRLFLSKSNLRAQNKKEYFEIIKVGDQLPIYINDIDSLSFKISLNIYNLESSIIKTIVK